MSMRVCACPFRWNNAFTLVRLMYLKKIAESNDRITNTTIVQMQPA